MMRALLPLQQPSMGRRFLIMAAENNEYFPIGSVVVCEIYHNTKIEGEVLAFDPNSKMLILKCPSSNGKALQSDVHIVNLNYVRDVTVKKEATSSPPPMQSLNLSRLTTRTKTNTDEKMRIANAMAAGVSPEGQKLFLVISKTFEDITWKGETIVVMDRVTVCPPYRPENCNGITSDNSAAETQIRKIIEKHLKDQEIQEAALQSSNSIAGHSSQSQQ